MKWHKYRLCRQTKVYSAPRARVHAYVHSHKFKGNERANKINACWAESRNFAFAPTHTGAFPDAHSAPFLTHFAKVIRFCADVSREMCATKIHKAAGKAVAGLCGAILLMNHF